MSQDLFNSLDFDKPFIFMSDLNFEHLCDPNGTMSVDNIAQYGIAVYIAEEPLLFYDLREPHENDSHVADDVVIDALVCAYKSVRDNHYKIDVGTFHVFNGVRHIHISSRITYDAETTTI